MPCLQVPNVAMNPPLELIQGAINQCAKKVLTISKSLPCWGMPEVRPRGRLGGHGGRMGLGSVGRGAVTP